MIIEKLKSNRVRKTTAKNYLSIWRQFNQFIIRLDRKPNSWEDKTSLFLAYLIEKGTKSSTIRSYTSAIKGTLKDDGYDWNDNLVLLHSMTSACKILNDTVTCRLPIQKGLLEILLFELERLFSTQFYLQITYQAIFCLAYYGLMRIGELTQGDHPVKAKDIHMATNKNKILLILHTSKTHARDSYPQQIKITEIPNSSSNQKIFCPFKAVRNYITLRGDYDNSEENFFIFKDKEAMKPSHVRSTLRSCLKAVDLQDELYDTHSFRIGRATDMLKAGMPIELIRQAGRWRSNCIYRYLRN